MSERQELEDAVDEFAAAMKKRLRSKQKQGWHGWDYLSADSFASRLLKNAAQAAVHRDKKSMVDAANFAMMLWQKQK